MNVNGIVNGNGFVYVYQIQCEDNKVATGRSLVRKNRIIDRFFSLLLKYLLSIFQAYVYLINGKMQAVNIVENWTIMSYHSSCCFFENFEYLKNMYSRLKIFCFLHTRISVSASMSIFFIFLLAISFHFARHVYPIAVYNTSIRLKDFKMNIIA